MPHRRSASDPRPWSSGSVAVLPVSVAVVSESVRRQGVEQAGQAACAVVHNAQSKGHQCGLGLHSLRLQLERLADGVRRFVEVGVQVEFDLCRIAGSTCID